MLHCGEQEFLETSRNTLPSKLYLVLFPTNNLCVAVDIVKHILAKERLDRQLVDEVLVKDAL